MEPQNQLHFGTEDLLCNVSPNRIMESLKLEKPFKIIKSNF